MKFSRMPFTVASKSFNDLDVMVQHRLSVWQPGGLAGLACAESSGEPLALAGAAGESAPAVGRFGVFPDSGFLQLSKS